MSFLPTVILWAATSLLMMPYTTAQVGTFDSGSDGSDGPLFIRGTLPPVEGFSATYDSDRNEVVAFGGRRYLDPRGEISETYLFDGVSWRQVARDSRPSPREGAAMAYDPIRQQVVLFGNDGSAGDTWVWDSVAWAEMTPAVSPANGYRGQHAMAFMPSLSRIVLVTRVDFSSEEMETWTFDGANWAQHPATLTHRNEFDMVYDASLERIVLIGRNASEGGFDTWLFDGTGWTQQGVGTLPISTLGAGDLVFDGREGVTAFYSRDEAYAFDGTSWTSIANVPVAFAGSYDQLVYNSTENTLVKLNGGAETESGGFRRNNETWAWRADGTTELLTEGSYIFDMTERANGLWQFTDIDIGPNVIVEFAPNADNTSVRWLASGNVVIDGIIDLSATRRLDETLDFGSPGALGARGGPGGFDGASSGPLGRSFRVPGNGPGFGLYDGTTSNARNGEFTSYGNAWLYPIIGGSGGGSTGFGSGAGGGGGAIMIASSGDIVLNGSLIALGDRSSNLSSSPNGSHGGALLRANRLKGAGTVDVKGYTGDSDARALEGRIRLEAWENPLAEAMSDRGELDILREAGVPLLPNQDSATVPKLWVDQIASVSVANPPLSQNSVVDPDVALAETGSVNIVVKGENVPAGAEVSLFISLEDNTTIEPAPALYDGTQATFNVVLPEGFGAINATARFPADG